MKWNNLWYYLNPFKNRMFNKHAIKHMGQHERSLRAALIVVFFACLFAFWHESMKVFFFSDDWGYFLRFGLAKMNGDPGEVYKFFIETENKMHFMPLFKVLYYLQYKAFCLDPRGYHVVQLLLFGTSAVILYFFLLGETKYQFGAVLCTGLYAINSTYYHVIHWVFLQQMLLCLIFLLLALLSAKTAFVKDKPLFGAAFFCMLSALSWGMGTVSFLVIVFFVFYLAISLNSSADKKNVIRLTIQLSPVVLLFLGFLILKATHGGLSPSEADSGGTVKLSSKFLNTFALSGDMILKSFGIYLRDHFRNMLTAVSGGDNLLHSTAKSAWSLLALKSAAAIVYIVVLLVSLRKAPRQIKAFAFLGLIMMLFYAAAISFVRVSVSMATDITEISRYKLYPFIGFVITLSCMLFLRQPKTSVRLALLAAFAGLALFHYSKTSTLFYSDQSAARYVQTVSQEIRSGPSRYLYYPPKISVGHMRNLQTLTFLHIFTFTNDRILPVNDYFLLLRNFVDLDTAKWIKDGGEGEFRIDSEGRMHITVPDEKDLSIFTKEIALNSLGHLTFQFLAEDDVNGKVVWHTKDKCTYRYKFTVPSKHTPKGVILPLANATDAKLVFGPGRLVIHSFRLYQ
jgi:hypothetical protein